MMERKQRLTTHKAHILKQIWEDPNSPLGSYDRHTPQYQPHHRQYHQGAQEPQSEDGEVPYAQAKLDWPEGKHDSCEHDDDHGDGAEDCSQWGTVVEPGVVCLWV